MCLARVANLILEIARCSLKFELCIGNSAFEKLDRLSDSESGFLDQNLTEKRVCFWVHSCNPRTYKKSETTPVGFTNDPELYRYLSPPDTCGHLLTQNKKIV
jgi:hypothetical protein